MNFCNFSLNFLGVTPENFMPCVSQVSIVKMSFAFVNKGSQTMGAFGRNYGEVIWAYFVMYKWKKCLEELIKIANDLFMLFSAYFNKIFREAYEIS